MSCAHLACYKDIKQLRSYHCRVNFVKYLDSGWTCLYVKYAENCRHFWSSLIWCHICEDNMLWSYLLHIFSCQRFLADSFFINRCSRAGVNNCYIGMHLGLDMWDVSSSASSVSEDTITILTFLNVFFRW